MFICVELIYLPVLKRLQTNIAGHMIVQEKRVMNMFFGNGAERIGF